MPRGQPATTTSSFHQEQDDDDSWADDYYNQRPSTDSVATTTTGFAGRKSKVAATTSLSNSQGGRVGGALRAGKSGNNSALLSYYDESLMSEGNPVASSQNTSLVMQQQPFTIPAASATTISGGTGGGPIPFDLPLPASSVQENNRNPLIISTATTSASAAFGAATVPITEIPPNLLQPTPSTSEPSLKKNKKSAVSTAADTNNMTIRSNSQGIVGQSRQQSIAEQRAGAVREKVSPQASPARPSTNSAHSSGATPRASTTGTTNIHPHAMISRVPEKKEESCQTRMDAAEVEELIAKSNDHSSANIPPQLSPGRADRLMNEIQQLKEQVAALTADRNKLEESLSESNAESYRLREWNRELQEDNRLLKHQLQDQQQQEVGGGNPSVAAAPGLSPRVGTPRAGTGANAGNGPQQVGDQQQQGLPASAPSSPTSGAGPTMVLNAENIRALKELFVAAQPPPQPMVQQPPQIIYQQAPPSSSSSVKLKTPEKADHSSRVPATHTSTPPRQEQQMAATSTAAQHHVIKSSSPGPTAPTATTTATEAVSQKGAGGGGQRNQQQQPSHHVDPIRLPAAGKVSTPSKPLSQPRADEEMPYTTTTTDGGSASQRGPTTTTTVLPRGKGDPNAVVQAVATVAGGSSPGKAGDRHTKLDPNAVRHSELDLKEVDRLEARLMELCKEKTDVEEQFRRVEPLKVRSLADKAKKETLSRRLTDLTSEISGVRRRMRELSILER